MLALNCSHKLDYATDRIPHGTGHLLWIEIEVRSIDLVKPPEQILGRAIHVITARIVGEVIAQRRTRKLLAEQVDFVQEQDDTSSLKPPRVDNRIKEN